VLICPPWYRRFCFEYYRTRDDIDVRGVPEEIFADKDLRRLRERVADYPRTWIIYFQEGDPTALLADNFPDELQPTFSRMWEYSNFQAGRRMGIRVYLLARDQEAQQLQETPASQSSF